MVTTPKTQARIISGLIIGGSVALLAVLGGPFWTCAGLTFYLIANREMLSLMAAKTIYPSKLISIMLSLTFYLFAFLGLHRHFDVVVTIGIILTFAWLLCRKNMATISDIGATILMFFYLGFLPAHFIMLRQLGADTEPAFWLQPGLRYVFWVLLTVSASDVFAYFAGKHFGKNLLSPQISPKKTVEGSLLGTLLATGVSVLIALWFGIHWGHGVILGFLISVVAQMGDLSESLLKRDAGMKDSGNLIPGHGGVLDRIDSYIFSGAVAYYYIVWFILHQGVAKEVIEFLSR